MQLYFMHLNTCIKIEEVMIAKQMITMQLDFSFALNGWKMALDEENEKLVNFRQNSSQLFYMIEN